MIITILRKHLEGTVINNIFKHGCGALNIDATRISTSDNLNGGAYAENPTERGGEEGWSFRRGGAGDYEQPSGRWPANAVLIHKEGCELKGCPVKELDRQSGRLKSGFFGKTDNYYSQTNYGDDGGASRFFKQLKKESEMIDYFKEMITPPVSDALVLVLKPEEIDFSLYKKEIYENGSLIPHYEPLVHGIILLGSPTQNQAEEILKILKPGAHCILIPEDIGYKSVVVLEDIGFEVRDSVFVADGENDFFYSSKASRSEREAGFDKTGEKRNNIHPTVKPISVMKWCARDLKKKSKVVDPFLGSGTTGVAMSRLNHNFLGVELNPEYAEICDVRIRHWMPIGSEIKSEVKALPKKQKNGDNISIFDL